MSYSNDFRFAYLFSLISERVGTDLFILFWQKPSLKNTHQEKILSILISYASPSILYSLDKRKRDLDKNAPDERKEITEHNLTEIEEDILVAIGELLICHIQSCRCCRVEITQQGLKEVFSDQADIILESLNFL
jgi:hypothetical protein